MRKEIKRYLPYIAEKWDKEVMRKIKDETGFDPGEQKDGVNTTNINNFVRPFLSIVPKGKIVRVMGNNENFVVQIETFIPEDDEVEPTLDNIVVEKGTGWMDVDIEKSMGREGERHVRKDK